MHIKLKVLKKLIRQKRGIVRFLEREKGFNPTSKGFPQLNNLFN